jgi:TPR repeat protein
MALPFALLFGITSWAQVGNPDKDALDCDIYASIDDIPSRGVKKAHYGFIDVDRALPSCSAAYAKSPKNSRVQAQLARIYFQQGKFEQGLELAKASAKEQAISLALLGEGSRRGVGGFSMNPREAVRYFQEGAERGNPDSMRSLAGAYAIGIGIEKDESKALALIQKASAADDANSVYMMAALHLNGRLGLAKSPDEAMNLVKKHADSGMYPPAQMLIALIIAQREQKITSEVKTYADPAIEALERLARQNSAEARYILANCYRIGLGVTRDLAKMFELYRKAADHNLVAAIAQAGVALASGNGTEKNITEGKKLLERASAMGSDEADKALATLWGK